MRATRFTFEQIERDIASPIVEVRSRAVHELANQVNQDPSIGPRALPIFQRMLPVEQDPFAVTEVARGIELILGHVAAVPLWTKLLDHPSPGVAASVALCLQHPDYVQTLLNCLRRRTEPLVRSCAINVLGRLKDPAVLPVLIEHLSDPSLRVTTIDALANHDDPAALPYLRPLLDDTSDGRMDDRGCMLTVGDVAGYAVRQLEHRANLRATTPAPAHKPISLGGEPARYPTASHLPTVEPIPLSTAVALPFAGPPRQWVRFAPYVPLALGLIEIPWAIMVLILTYNPQGGPGRTPQQTHTLDFVAALPALVGLLVGFYTVLRGRVQGGLAWTCVIIGSIVCGLAVFVFGLEFFN